MIPNGQYRIVSLAKGRPPTGVSPIRSASQSIRLNQPIQSWTVKQVGNHVYRLSISGYPFTGVLDNTVTASVHAEQDMKFHVTHRGAQGGYTIELANDHNKGWTIASQSSTDSEVQIKPITESHSVPPWVVPTQLFRFEPVHDS
ncbi:hypothetical protein SCLCIDRAFT_24978 [Scleroderma citrinum Foug A]|uniref:Uncharacterized protein n=1 Tax=Scleroderma citrinum Foug A TaxID=1036808 RepID=A0A0C3E1R1_9AGAM|nr:hypothetical protein SCLCIDRAFT_24978 [Scleroderma citrinum Foug A]